MVGIPTASKCLHVHTYFSAYNSKGSNRPPLQTQCVVPRLRGPCYRQQGAKVSGRKVIWTELDFRKFQKGNSNERKDGVAT